jgi:predicted nucleic acid-binding protein
MKIDENFFIDTNILVYSFDHDSVFYEFSKSLIDQNKDNICIASKTLSEFVCVFSKLKKNEIIENELEKIIETFTIFYPDKLSSNIYKNLVMKYKPKGNQAYDFEIISVMLANNIKKIATINKTDFENVSEIELITNDQ